MPRIYDSCNDPHDFCKSCYPAERRALAMYANRGDGPDGRGNCFGYDAEHPAYEFESYRCEQCHAMLDELDN